MLLPPARLRSLSEASYWTEEGALDFSQSCLDAETDAILLAAEIETNEAITWLDLTENAYLAVGEAHKIILAAAEARRAHGSAIELVWELSK